VQADRADPVLVAFFDGVGGFQLVTVIGAHLRFADPGIQVAPVMVDCAQQVAVGVKVVRIISATLGKNEKMFQSRGLSASSKTSGGTDCSEMAGWCLSPDIRRCHGLGGT